MLNNVDIMYIFLPIPDHYWNLHLIVSHILELHWEFNGSNNVLQNDYENLTLLYVNQKLKQYLSYQT